MSLHPQPFTAVPPETARVARAAFPQGNLYMHMRDELGAIYYYSVTNVKPLDFAANFPTRSNGEFHRTNRKRLENRPFIDRDLQSGRIL
jgi:hypothetical protein